jgi:F-type H+-transporting ATPase subunit b
MANIIALILSVPILYVLPKFVPLLKDLGVNETAPYMALFFAISYFFVSQFLIKPYKTNLEYRRKNTGGSLSKANEIAEQTEKLVGDYQNRLKKQNETAQDIFERIKKEGLQEEERVLSQARKNGSELIEQTKNKISGEMKVAKETLKTQIPQLSELIASQVLGRNLS